MSLVPLALSIALCLAFSCLAFFLRELARRPSRARLPVLPPGPAGSPPR